MCGHPQTLESGPHTLELQCVVSQRLWLQCLAGQRLEATHWTSSVWSPDTGFSIVVYSKASDVTVASVNEIELSVRAANCLNNANITSVGQLALKSEAEMLKYRNFGKKSLNEIKEKLQELGLSLGMQLDPSLLDQAFGPATLHAPLQTAGPGLEDLIAANLDE